MMFYIWWTSLSQKKLDEINYEKESPDNLGTLIFLNVIFTYANTVCLVLSYSSWGYKEGAPMNPTAGFFFPIHILLFLGKKKSPAVLPFWKGLSQIYLWGMITCLQVLYFCFFSTTHILTTWTTRIFHQGCRSWNEGRI